MLKLKKLELKNFGPIDGSKIIEYKDGLNLIQAENGKGKSNSIYAIEMLLIDVYEGSYENYINHNKDNFFIALDFEIDGHSYNISLDCSKAKNLTTTRILREDGEEIAKGEEAKQYLAKLLPPDIMRYALVAKQKPLDNITTCSDSDRRELFKRIKSMDYEKVIKEVLQPKIDATKEAITQKDKEIYALENYPYEDAKTLKQLPFTEDEYNAKVSEYKRLTKEKALVEEQKNRFAEIQQSYDDLLLDCQSNLSQQSTKESIISGYKKDIAELDEKDKILSADLITQKQGWKEKEERVIAKKRAEAEKDKTDGKARLSELTEQLENTDREYASIKIVKLVKFDDSRLEQAKEKFSSIKFTIDNCLKSIDSLKDGVCPVCGQSCTHKLVDYQDEHTRLLKELEEVTKEKADLEKAKADYDEKKEKAQNDKNRKESLQSQSRSLASQISLLQTNLDNIDKSVDKSIEQEKENTAKLIENLEKSVAETRASNKAMGEKLRGYIEQAQKELALLKEDYEKLRGQSLKKKEEISKFSIEDYDDSALVAVEHEIAVYDEIVLYNKSVKEFNAKLEETLERNQKDLADKKKEKASLQKEQFDLESAKNIMLRDFPNYVVDQSVESIEQSMNQFIEDCYYKSLSVCLRSTKTSIKLEYGTGARKLPSYRLSGAESKLVSLSFINNFNKMLNLGVLLLDEPDSAMDNERRRDLFTILLNMSEVYEQLVIITHSKEMSDYMLANSGDCNIITL